MSAPPGFGLGTFAAAGGRPFPGLVVDERVHDRRPAFGEHSTTLALLEDWVNTLATLHELAQAGPDGGIPFAELQALPPVQSRQLLCAGANYFDHVREIAFTLPQEQRRRTLGR